MHKQLLIWTLIRDSLRQQLPVMLLYVLDSRGSSPGRQGFFMAVNAREEMEGSVGGGIMEHKFVEMAKDRLSSREIKSVEIRKQYHDKNAAADQSGMICSGEQTILLYTVKKTDAPAVDQLISSLGQHKNGTLQLSPAGIGFLPSSPGEDFYFSYPSEKNWFYREKTGYKNQLYIIGGGHCALALSALMRKMDFYITVYEERKELHTLQKNAYAHEIIFVEDYSGLGHLIPSGRNQYIVIMTMGYRTDDIALRSLLGKSYTYLGVLGSKKKMKKMFDEFKMDGLTEEILQRINSPAGIDISSQTPEEIAVSIAAAIIRVKNSGQAA